MPAETASLPLFASPASERSAWVRFLHSELAPFPGRAIGTVRVTIACVVVLVLCMALRIPEPHLAVWVVTRVAMEESSASLLTGTIFLVAITVGICLGLVCLMVAMDQPALRFCLLAGMAFLGLFLRQTFVIGGLGFVIGLISAIVMTLPDFVPSPELAVRGSLWLWPVFALGIIAAVAANLLIAPTDPAALLREELVARLRATADAIARQLGASRQETRARQLAESGVARLLLLLKSAAVVHESVKRERARWSALITLTDRLVGVGAALNELRSVPLGADERAPLERIAHRLADMERAVAERETLAVSSREGDPLRRLPGGTRVPLLIELEHVVDSMQRVLEREDFAAAQGPAEPEGLFVSDAFTNPSYVRYALKGTLAVVICYVLQSAVVWPGIRTCLVTCLIVGLGTEGATIQKGTLRIAGALVGAALGFLAILFLVPHMESIASLASLVAAGAAVAAWVVLGSPRISYAGVQLAFAFFVCVIQGFEPTWHFYTIRDRLIGILLGNVVITVVFHYVWPVPASDAMWTSLASALRAMARLASVENRGGNATAIAAGVEALSTQASHHFTTAQQLADQAAFEFSAPREGATMRERLQDAAADAQLVFLTELAMARRRSHGVDGLPAEMRAFDALVERTLETIACEVERGAPARRNVPVAAADLGAALTRLEARIEHDRLRTARANTATFAVDRLALYRELVPQIARLASGTAA